MIKFSELKKGVIFYSENHKGFTGPVSLSYYVVIDRVNDDFIETLNLVNKKAKKYGNALWSNGPEQRSFIPTKYEAIKKILNPLK